MPLRLNKILALASFTHARVFVVATSRRTTPGRSRSASSVVRAVRANIICIHCLRVQYIYIWSVVRVCIDKVVVQFDCTTVQYKRKMCAGAELANSYRVEITPPSMAFILFLATCTHTHICSASNSANCKETVRDDTSIYMHYLNVLVSQTLCLDNVLVRHRQRQRSVLLLSFLQGKLHR